MIEIEHVRDLEDEYSVYMVKTDHPFDLEEFSQELGLKKRPKPFEVRAQTFVLTSNAYITTAIVKKELLNNTGKENRSKW